GDDAGHVGAVTVGVDVSRAGVLGFERQVGAVDNLAGGVEAVDGGDARVDDGHVHALTGDAAGPQGLGPVVHRGRVHRVLVGLGVVAAVVGAHEAHLAVRRHPGDALGTLQARHLVGGHLGGEPVDDADLATDLAAGAGDGP